VTEEPETPAAPVPPPPDGRPLLLFDGDCGWCTGWAGWLCRRDRRGRFLLAPLGGETARRYLPGPPPPDTMVLIEPAGPAGGRVSVRSRAVLGVLEGLGWPWRAAALLRAVPAGWSDRLYTLVARRRHALPGSGAACEPCETGAVPPDRLLP
jgi:predicted DCC family thiol-disulfide oxidoreductase YuxK